MNKTGAGTLVPSKETVQSGAVTSVAEKSTTEVVPPRYKQTKVGIVPEDWDVVKLGDIASRITEKNKDDSIDKVFSNSAINGIVLQNEYFDREIANKNNLTGYYVVESGDFVYNPRISKTAPAGPINRNLHSTSGIVSPLYTVFRTQKNENINYLEYFFSSTLWFRYMQCIANYGARHDRMNITNSDFMKMPIPYPPLKEQQRIAQILSTWDDAISKQEQLLVAKETLKKGLMQRLLSGEVRFAGFDGEWEEVQLGDICKFTQGTQIPFSEQIQNYREGYIRYLYIRDFFTDKDICYVKDIYPTKVMKKEDIMIVNTGNTAGTVYSGAEGVLSNNAFKITFEKNIIFRDFLFSFLKSHVFKHNIERLFNSSGQPHVGHKNIARVPFTFPSLVEQEKIAQVLTTADKEIELLKNELEALKEQKRGLMQRLLTGEVRVMV